MEQWKVLNTWLILQESFSNPSLKFFWDILERYKIFKEDIIESLQSPIKWKRLINSIKLVIKEKIHYKRGLGSLDRIVISLERYPVFRDKAEELLANFIKKGGSMIIGEEIFSIFPGLKLIDDPPYVLFILGNLKELSIVPDIIGIVGTRALTFNTYNYSKKLLGQLFKFKRKIATISGYARGVDKLIYKETVANNNIHIAVLPVIGIGKLSLYIKEVSNYKMIFLSEYLRSHDRVCNWEFVRRNRIIAGLADFVMVMQAPLGSGACITAHFASSFNKNVYVLLNDLDNNQGGVKLVLDYNIARFFAHWLHIFKFEKDSLYMESMKYYRDSLVDILKHLGMNIVPANLDYFIEIMENNKMDVISVLKRYFKISNNDLKKVVLKLSQLHLIKKGRKSYLFNIINF